MTRLLTASVAMSALLTAPTLAQSVFELDEIIFTATAEPTTLERIGTSVAVIEGADLNALGDQQLSDVLTRLPGITFRQAGPPGTTSGLSIRGATSRYISVYIDGIMVNDPTEPSGSFDNFGGLTTGSIRRIEILRGSQSALYGGTAVGGVVSITTLADEDTPLGLTQNIEVQGGSYGTFGLDYAMTFADETTRFSFGLSTVTSDGFSAGDTANGNSEADAYDQTRLSFGVEHDLTSNLTIGFNGFHEIGRNEFDEFGSIPALGAFGPIDGTTPDEVSDRTATGLRLYADYDIGSWSHEASLSSYTVTRESSRNGTTTAFEGERYAFDYVGGYEFSDQYTLLFGLDAREDTATYPNQAGGSNSIQTFGGFIEAAWSPTETVDVIGTVRYDDHSTFGDYTTGRIAIAYRPVEGLTLRAAIGTGYRPPSLDQLYGDYGSFVGNPNLQPETSVSYEVGADYVFAGGAQIGATLFLLEIDNLITSSGFGCPTTVTPFVCDLGTFSTLGNVSGTSTRSGIEIAAFVPLNDRVSLTGAYTYTDAYAANGRRLTNIPRHDLVLGVDAMLTDRFSLSATAQHVADRASGRFDPQPYADYTLFNATFGYALTDDVEAFFRIENILDEQYQLLSGYGTSDRAFYVGLRASF